MTFRSTTKVTFSIPRATLLHSSESLGGFCWRVVIPADDLALARWARQELLAYHMQPIPSAYCGTPVERLSVDWPQHWSQCSRIACSPRFSRAPRLRDNNQERAA